MKKEITNGRRRRRRCTSTADAVAWQEIYDLRYALLAPLSRLALVRSVLLLHELFRLLAVQLAVNAPAPEARKNGGGGRGQESAIRCRHKTRQRAYRTPRKITNKTAYSIIKED